MTNNLKLLRRDVVDNFDRVRLVCSQRGDWSQAPPDGISDLRVTDLVDQPNPGDGTVELLAREKWDRLHSSPEQDGLALTFRVSTSAARWAARTGSRCRLAVTTREYPLKCERRHVLVTTKGCRGDRLSPEEADGSGSARKIVRETNESTRFEGVPPP